MATAFQHVKVVPDGVNLTLSQHEAEILMTILGCVGGCPDTSNRKVSAGILEALIDTQEEKRFYLHKHQCRGYIMFPTL